MSPASAQAARHPEDSPRTALVTGGSRGIGRAVVRRLLDDGYRVVNFSRSAPADLWPGEQFVAVDLGDTDRLQAAAAELVAAQPVLHLVNNAALIQVADVDRVSTADMQHHLQLNLLAPLLLLQALLPAMKRCGYGRVVNLGSRAALGKPGRSAYGATKAALAGMSRTWALELAPLGITVNTVAPGPVATELFNQSNPPGAPGTLRLTAEIPVGRVGQPEEVAHAVASLLDARAGFITGQTLYLCGGLTVGNAAAS